jgi:hypothetical protein
MFVGKAKSLPLSGALGKIPELLANIRLGWKGLLGTNTNLLQIFLNYRCKNLYNIVYRLKKLAREHPSVFHRPSKDDTILLRTFINYLYFIKSSLSCR